MLQNTGGRQGPGVRAAQVVPIRSTLPKGELANIPPGVEGMMVCNQLINTVREETRQVKSNITSPYGVVKLALEKIAPESLHAGMIKGLQAALEEEFDQAARGECVDGTGLSLTLDRVIEEHLPPHIQQSTFVHMLIKTLAEVMPDRCRLQNAEMETQVSSRGLKLPPHAHLRASSSGGREQEDTSGGGVLAQLQRQLGRADGDIKIFMRMSAAKEETIRRDIVDAEVTLEAENGALVAAKAELQSFTPAAGGGNGNDDDGGGAAAGAPTLASLQQAVAAATQKRTQAEQKLEALQQELSKHEQDTVDGISERMERFNKLSRGLGEYSKAQAGSKGGPVKLEEIVYTGEYGEEQAIFLPTLKLLTIFKCLVCVPTPDQIQRIMT